MKKVLVLLFVKKKVHMHIGYGFDIRPVTLFRVIQSYLCQVSFIQEIGFPLTQSLVVVFLEIF